MTELTIPRELLPRDGRFGSGPSKVRPEALAGLAATGTSYLGTSHRRDGVRSVVRRVREGLAELLRLPDGYEVVLGDGGATIFWDIAVVGLIRERAQLLSFGEFSDKFARAVTAAPWLKPPTVATSPAGQAPAVRGETGIDTYCWPQNETSTGVVMPVRRPDGADPGALTLIDATSAAGAIPVDLRETDAYYLAPQKVLAGDGGLWLAVLSPAAIERAQRLRAESGRWMPAMLDLTIAIEQSRADQTYNTPALATLWLVADQIEWLIDRGGLDWAAGRTAESAKRLYAWADAASYAQCFVGDPEKRSPTVGTVRFDDAVAATPVTKVLRSNGIVDTEAYRGAGYNGLRIGMFPAVDPDDVEALTACVDWVVERL